MGSACCVAAKDKSIVTASNSDVVLRNTRHSPTWSFRWENRGRVAGEETSISWVSDGRSRNGRSDTKYESNCTSAYDSPSDSFGRRILQKSPVSEVASVPETTSATERTIARNISMDNSSDNVKEVADSSPSKLSPSTLLSSPSRSTSPLSVHNHSYTMPRWHSNSGKGSTSFSVTCGKPFAPPWRSDSAKGSCGGSSDGWSVNTIPELFFASHRDSFSMENDYMNTSYEDSHCDGISVSSSVGRQACGICKRIVREYSVVAVLICGHSYHAECLEMLTPEANKYDPACPLCAFDELKGSKSDSKCPKLSSSSSQNGSTSKPLIRRHFSFGFGRQSSKKKGYFWSRSLKA